MKDALCIEQRLIDAICEAIRTEAGVHSCTDAPAPESFDSARLPAAWVTESEYDLRVGQTFDPLLFPVLTIEIVLAYPCKAERYERDGRKYRAAIEAAMYGDETFGDIGTGNTKYLGAQIGTSEVPGTGMVISRWEIEYVRVRKNPYKRDMEE